MYPESGRKNYHHLVKRPVVLDVVCRDTRV